ncbi:DNA dC-_dU-editing enzyme APOBEC-3F-like [Protopterus annectens]|uniref:DNA dC->dU-editing enzyme APOBEC-3F-like n=1 Tax=Protopterus annectens TaxID=7888 RepID=UPI001CFB144F|nr:DNA dC->dU-editing enzyme APOBEC-3F-like [Protopterus annectens]
MGRAWLYYTTLKRDFRKNFFPIGTSCIVYMITANDMSDFYRSGLSLKWRNQREHAEEECIDKLEYELCNVKRPCTVTLFMSWTPCSECVPIIIDFVQRHRNVRLRILAARIYYHEEPENREGLRILFTYCVDLKMMKWADYYFLWYSFGDNKSISRELIYKPHPYHGITNWETELRKILQGGRRKVFR